MATAAELLTAANAIIVRADGMLMHLGPEDDGHGKHYSDSPDFLALAATWREDAAAHLALEPDP